MCARFLLINAEFGDPIITTPFVAFYAMAVFVFFDEARNWLSWLFVRLIAGVTFFGVISLFEQGRPYLALIALASLSVSVFCAAAIYYGLRKLTNSCKCES